MKIASEKLIQDLVERTQMNIHQVEKFSTLSEEVLNRRPQPDKWSILECIAHLNLYGDFYIPELSKRIAKSKTETTKIFKAGILGNYFAKTMLPKEKLNKMKTFKDKNPMGSSLDKTTLQRFLGQQEQLLDLLKKAGKIDLNKTKTAISISKWIKLRLGDTFRVVIYHNDRHIVQANKILEKPIQH